MINRIKSLISNPTYKKYFFNTGWLLSEKIIRIFANAVVGIFVARYLGPVDYGLFNYALATISILLPIASLGMSDTLIREFHNDDKNINEILGTSFILKFVSGVFLISILLLYLKLLRVSGMEYLVTVIVSFGLITSSFDVWEKHMMANVKGKSIAFVSIVSLFISSIIKLIGVYFKMDLIYFAICQIVEMSILVIGWLFYFKKDYLLSVLTFNLNRAIKLLKDSGILIVSSFMVILYMRLDQFMIKSMLGAEALGNFSAAIKLSESYYFIPLVLTGSLFPAILNGKKISEFEYKKRVQNLYNLLTIISLTMAIVLSSFSSQLALLFGSKYTGVAQVLSVHVWAGIFVFWGTASTKWFVIEKMPFYITFSTVLGFIFNIALNFYLIPYFGIVGAAYSTLIAQSVAVVFSLLFFRKTRPLFKIIINSLNPLQFYLTKKS